MAAIVCEALSESFGPTRALEPLDLEVTEGDVIGYLGPDGAGKTTTVRRGKCFIARSVNFQVRHEPVIEVA